MNTCLGATPGIYKRAPGGRGFVHGVWLGSAQKRDMSPSSRGPTTHRRGPFASGAMIGWQSKVGGLLESRCKLINKSSIHSKYVGIYSSG